MEIKHRLQLYIQSQTADAAPPLGTVLGNLGVNTVNFCKEFNSYTAELPSYFTLSVNLQILSNRSYRFSVGRLPLGPLLQLLSQEVPTPKGKKDGPYRSMALRQAIQLARWQYPTLDLPRSFPLLLGTLRSARIFVKLA
jgi:large subunit ribosomal protein L11